MSLETLFNVKKMWSSWCQTTNSGCVHLHRKKSNFQRPPISVLLNQKEPDQRDFKEEDLFCLKYYVLAYADRKRFPKIDPLSKVPKKYINVEPLTRKSTTRRKCALTAAKLRQ